MYEEYTSPIPDIEAYAKRLGMEDRYDPTAEYPMGEPNKELLDALVDAHQTHIPFDDLDSYDLKREVSLKVDDLFNKVVASRRGGFCFELNGIFSLFLRDIGYKVYPVFARTCYQHEDPWPILHRGTVVDLGDESVYCDVGCGSPMACCSIPLVDGATVHSRGQVYSMQPLPQKPGWWRVNFHHDGSGPIERTVEFLNCPVEWADMIALARHCSTAPTSPFTFKRLCNLRVSDGYYALTDNELTISHGGVKEVRELTSNEEIAQVLDEYFNIGTPELDEHFLGK